MINITGSLKSIDECYFPYTEGNESLVEAAFEERVTRQVKAISDQVVGPADRSLHVVYWPFSEYEGKKGNFLLTNSVLTLFLRGSAKERLEKNLI